MPQDDGIVHDYPFVFLRGEDEFDVGRDGWGEPKLGFHGVPLGVYAEIYSFDDDDNLGNFLTIIPQILFL